MADNNMCDPSSCGGSCESCDGNITVTLTLDDGSLQECTILTIFPVDGKDYIALLPMDENGQNNDGEVYLYRYINTPGSPSIENIEDDDEYEAAADMFDQLLDAAEYEELYGDDDAD